MSICLAPRGCYLRQAVYLGRASEPVISRHEPILSTATSVISHRAVPGWEKVGYDVLVCMTSCNDMVIVCTMCKAVKGDFNDWTLPRTVMATDYKLIGSPCAP